VEKVFDLGSRTFIFSKSLITFLQHQSKNQLINPVAVQLIRSGTSIGANYREADGAESKKDFIHKIKIAKKEAKETLYWLGIIYEGFKIDDPELIVLIGECKELVRILGKISVS
jgi:four helix bundle protein